MLDWMTLVYNTPLSFGPTGVIHAGIEKRPDVYGNIQVLKDVNMILREGEIITLIGANGAGKTTTLMSISGIVPPRSGEILFMNRPLTQLSPDAIVALGLSQVPEGRRIFPNLTVTENLDMGAFLRRDKDGIRKDLEYVFDLFPILAQRRHQPRDPGGGSSKAAIAGLMARRACS